MVAHEKRNSAQLFCAVPTRNDLALSSLLFPAQPAQKLEYPGRPEGRNCKQMIKNRPPVHRQAIQTGKCKKVSQSLRPQAQRKWKSFSPAACTSEKIPLGSQTCALCACGVQCVRCSELQSLPTRTQRSGPRWDALTRCCPGTCPQPRPRPAGRRDTSRRARRRPCAAW